jgi:glycosyltransferase involved in cell wall biosynthesis
MKIALFTEVYRPVVNGVVNSIDALTGYLRKCGHEVYTFAPHMPNGGDTLGGVFRMPSLPLPARTEYRLTLPLVARRNKRRFLSRCDIIHSHSLFITGWMASYYARHRFRVPLVFTYHTMLDSYTHYSPLGARLTSQLARELTRSYANAADAVIVPTQAVALELRRQEVSAPICVTPTGIDIDSFRSPSANARSFIRQRHGIAEDAPLILAVSRLAHEKNIPLLFEALVSLRARLPQVRLLLVGAGPLGDELRFLSRKNGLDGCVVFCGAVPQTALPAYYAAADVFCFPSTTETQGIVLAEAFAAGLPIIAIDTPQTRDVFGVHLAGKLVSGAQAMAAATHELLADPAKRAAASAHARAAAVHFDVAVTGERMLAVYKTVLASRAGSPDMAGFESLFEVVDIGA